MESSKVNAFETEGANQSKILCVDEDLSFLCALERVLTLSGFKVVAVGDHGMALNILADDAETFGTIVLSHSLKKPGIELCQVARDRGYVGRLVVISNCIQIPELRSFHHCGVSGFFQKPLKPELLVNVMLHYYG